MPYSGGARCELAFEDDVKIIHGLSCRKVERPAQDFEAEAAIKQSGAVSETLGDEEAASGKLFWSSLSNGKNMLCHIFSFESEAIALRPAEKAELASSPT